MSLNFSSFNLDKLNKNNEKKNNSASLLSLAFCEKEDFSFFSEQKLFNYSSDESTEQSSKSLSINNYKNNSIHKNKLKKIKNYNYMKRPATAPHKDKTSKEKKGNKIIPSIQENKKGINNYNKNFHKVNQRPASSGQGKNKNKNDYIMKYNNTAINMGKRIEIDFGNKQKNSFSKKRMVSPKILNNKGVIGNNNNSKFNIAKYRVPSPLTKSTSFAGKALKNSKSNMSYNMNKSASFNMK